MDGLIMALQLIVAFSILVVLHEWGHFIAARIFGIRVEKFYMFFNPKFSLLTYRKGDGVKFFQFHRSDKKLSEEEKEKEEKKKAKTTYGIGWLPLGGYVKIAGMIDESMDKEQMKKPPQPWEFRSKPPWQRLIVMTGGVIMNLILGVVVLSFILLNYTKSYLPKDEVNKDGIYAYELGRDMGFETGDKIIEIDGKEFERFSEIVSTKVFFGADITVERNNKKLTIQIPDTLYKIYKKSPKLFIAPHNYKFKVDSLLPTHKAKEAGLRVNDIIAFVEDTKINSYGQLKELLSNNIGKDVELVLDRNGSFDTITVGVDSSAMIGFAISAPPYKFTDYSIGSSLKYGLLDAYELLYANIKGIGKIFTGEEKASESIGGPIKIATMFGGTWEWERFWRLVGLLSLILAFMNILPIPALDGGHVILTLIEMITGKPIPEKAMERIQMVGIIIIFGLMILIFGNDIFSLIK